jgi:hypothetical protein
MNIEACAARASTLLARGNGSNAAAGLHYGAPKAASPAHVAY